MNLTNKDLHLLADELTHRIKFVCNCEKVKYSEIRRFLLGSRTADEERNNVTVEQMLSKRLKFASFIITEIHIAVQEFGGNALDELQFESYVRDSFKWPIQDRSKDFKFS